MNISRKRRVSEFLRYAQPACDVIGLLCITIFFINFLPLGVFNPDPATGGDTGSHFWPLVTLVNNAFPNFSVRVWNPGNLAGEPHLVHYFPLPYFIMAALSLFMPLGSAFSIGTLLPLLCLPLATYWGIRQFGLRFPIPILAAVSTLFFLYNESYSMWGGNILSTMAGQFAHVYAFNFMILAIGCLANELRSSRFPFYSSFLFAAVNLSHGYLMLGTPLVFLAFLVLSNKSNFKSRLIILFASGVFSVLLSAWFLIPMFDNAKWTIPFFIYWNSENLFNEILPEIFYPVVVALLLSAFILFIVERKNRYRFVELLIFWMILISGYGIYYFIFPLIGVVNVRAVPQAQFFVCLLSAISFGLLIRKKRILSIVLVLPLVFSAIYWSNLHSQKFPTWAKWNYSGWFTKPVYKNLAALYDHLRGDFSMPRVIYEHNSANSSAGTERVFEMLPYFANRATLESVYLQASIIAPAAFLLQSEVSKTPSCPFYQFQCSSYNLSAARERLVLLGVGDLILVTPELVKMAQDTDFLTEDGRYGQWTLFKTNSQPRLAEVFSRAPLLSSDPYWKNKYFKNAGSEDLKKGVEKIEVDPDDWKDLFYHWFKNYDVAEPMIVVDRWGTSTQIPNLADNKPDEIWSAKPNCTPEVTVDFNRIFLRTNCPGKAHYLKFAYHSTWKTDTGDVPFLVSPGFIGLIPSREEVTLVFGESWLWRAAGFISIISFVAMCFLVKTKFKKK